MQTTESEVGKVVNLSPVLSSHDAWKALRDTAQALVRVANAMLGEPAALPATSQSALLEAVPSQNVVTTVNDFLLAKARAGRSDRYLRQLRVSLTSFSAGRALRPVASICVAEVEKWLDSKDWSARTQRGYLADVRTLFNFAERRGLVRHNPAKGVELPALENLDPPGIHTPDEVRKVLETARAANLDVCRKLAIRYFAGLRSSEAHRVTEENILLDQDLIDVPAAKSKTRRRRLVTIQPNLKAWLSLGGELRKFCDYYTLRPILRASKVEWRQNVTRHSFVSYHLAYFENAGKTALQAGHTEQMTFSNYRAVVTKQQAAEFWAIVPR